MRKALIISVAPALWLMQAAPLLAAEKTICVTVAVKEPPEVKEAQPPQPAPQKEAAPDLAPLTEEERLKRMQQQMMQQQLAQLRPPPSAESVVSTPNVPIGQNPVDYLKRLMEHFVTHERGFVAVQGGCQERIDVEMYPLREGWTVFARYSGHGREERVDYLYSDELSQFAERVVLALLYDQAIGTTIKRDTVLRADSKKAVQRIRGTNHFLLGLGTQLRGGYFPTVQEGGDAISQIRVFGPMSLGLGYRGKFENWGISSTVQLGIGTSKTGLQQNEKGGHIDYGGNVSLSLHFLRYLNPRGLTSTYVGAGATFEILWFYQIRPKAERSPSGERTNLVSGGLDVEVLLGFEFMRASRVHFFLEGALLVPAYWIDNSDSLVPIGTWFPGIGLKLGMMF